MNDLLDIQTVKKLHKEHIEDLLKKEEDRIAREIEELAKIVRNELVSNGQCDVIEQEFRNNGNNGHNKIFIIKSTPVDKQVWYRFKETIENHYNIISEAPRFFNSAQCYQTKSVITFN